MQKTLVDTCETDKQRTESIMNVTMYTDGASRGNPGPGGFGTVLHFTDTQGNLHAKEISQGFTCTTNNRMELLAVIAGFEALKKPCTVDVFSDSKYVVDAFNQHWVEGWLKRGWKNAKKEPVKNIDLWKRLLEAKKPHTVTFHWVRDTLKTSVATNLQQALPTETIASLMQVFLKDSFWTNGFPTHTHTNAKKPSETKKTFRKLALQTH